MNLTEYSDQITRNFIFGESWSTKIINGRAVKRQVPPESQYMDNVILTAQQGQIVRDRLNEDYGNNRSVGTRNRSGEIILPVNSWWRENIFQNHLHRRGLTRVDGYKLISSHQLGLAKDYPTPRGMTPVQFRNFVRDRCNTKFTWFKLYSWGIHCEIR